MAEHTATICAACGTGNPAGFRFCGACGQPLVEVASTRPTRKTVTALFCDVTGSTALGEQLDPEVLRGVMNRYFAEIRAAIERHGGTVEKFIGDAVMAVFGIPRVREDDALRAVRAAAEIRELLPTLAGEVGVELRFRTGVNTGQVLAGEGENLAIGDAINVAARFEQAAAPGEIVIGSETLSLVRDAVTVEAIGPLALKGKAEPIPAYRLLAVDRSAEGVARHLDAPLVGRERELQLLTDVWERTVRTRSCQLFTLLGAAGIGKSRLTAELLDRVGAEARVLRGRCLPYGEGITFWPLVEALVPVGDAAQPVVERITSGGAASPEELFWDVRGLLETLAVERPVLLHLDDLQWAEGMLFDLVDHVADLSRGVPILLLCTARPELLEERPAWAGGKLNATTVLLEALDVGDSERLLDQLGGGLDPADRLKVIAAADGNALFLEEMVALAREQGTVEIPPTIQALLAARLERLGGEERDLLERGAVEGEVFHLLAVRALADEDLAGQIEPRLSGLVRKELIRPHPATLQGDQAFRFRHLLIRDAAYDALPKAERAELHERFARWLESLERDLPEADEITGWHLEQALRYERELGRTPDGALIRDAARHLWSAGRKASARLDQRATRSLFERALAMLPEADPLWGTVAIDLIDVLIDLEEGATTLDRADELLSLAERRPGTQAMARLSRVEWAARRSPGLPPEDLVSGLPALIAAFEAAGDHAALVKAHRCALWMSWMSAQGRAAARHARAAAHHAGLAGDLGYEARALSWTLVAVMFSGSAAELEAEIESLEAGRVGPHLRCMVTSGRADLALRRGDIDAARRLTDEGQALAESLGDSVLAMGGRQYRGHIELVAGEIATARELFTRLDGHFAAMDERGYRSTVQACLALSSYELGDRAAAEAAIALSDELSAPQDEINFAMTHALRGRLALEDGDVEGAERWGRSAVDHAYRTDFWETRGQASFDLGDILGQIGKRDAALAELERSRTAYAGAGEVLRRDRAARRVAALSARR